MSLFNFLNHEEELLETELKRYGHTLGLSFKYKTTESSKEISSSGNRAYSSLNILTELLGLYVQEKQLGSGTISPSMIDVFTIYNQRLKYHTSIIQSIFNLGELNLIKGFNNIKDDIVGKFSKNKSFLHNGVYLGLVHTERHLFTIAYNEDCFVVVNRGRRPDNIWGIKKYQLRTGAFEQLNAKNFYNLAFRSEDDAEKYFSVFFDNQEIDCDFGVKNQKIGNCSFANVKSMIRPLLYMFGETIADADNEYKEFTCWYREYEIKQLIKKYLNARNNKKIKFEQLYKELIVKYIEKHINRLKSIEIKNNLQDFRLKHNINVKTTWHRKNSTSHSAISKDRGDAYVKLIMDALKDDVAFYHIFSTIDHSKFSDNYTSRVDRDYAASTPDNKTEALLLFSFFKIYLLILLVTTSFPLAVISLGAYLLFNKIKDKINGSVNSHEPQEAAIDKTNDNYETSKDRNNEHTPTKKDLLIFSLKSLYPSRKLAKLSPPQFTDNTQLRHRQG